MLFLLLLVPLVLICLSLAWVTWRAGHPKIALVMTLISLLCAALAVGIAVTGAYVFNAR